MNVIQEQDSFTIKELQQLLDLVGNKLNIVLESASNNRVNVKMIYHKKYYQEMKRLVEEIKDER